MEESEPVFPEYVWHHPEAVHFLGGVDGGDMFDILMLGWTAADGRDCWRMRLVLEEGPMGRRGKTVVRDFSGQRPPMHGVLIDLANHFSRTLIRCRAAWKTGELARDAWKQIVAASFGVADGQWRQLPNGFKLRLG